MSEFIDKLNAHERELYERLQIAKERKRTDKKLISPVNNLISFNPFQYEPYYKLFKQTEYPKAVYIADEVGAGKTIETGIILTELLFQGEISFHKDICLIICPNLLCRKWRQTLKVLFGLDASIVYSLKDIHSGLNIVSFDTISRTELSISKLALLIIDEAHNASGSRFEKIKAIRERVDLEKGYVVLLSATPLNGSDNDEEKQVELLLSDKSDKEEKKENSGSFFSKESWYLSKNTKEVMRYAVNPHKYTVNVGICNHFVENKALMEFKNCCHDLFSGKNTLLQFQGLNQIMSSPKAGLLYLESILNKDNNALLEYLTSSHEKVDSDDESENEEPEVEEYYKEYSMEDVKSIRSKLESIRVMIQGYLEKDTDAKFNKLLEIIEDNKSKFKDNNNLENKEWKFYNHIIVFTDRVSTAHYLEKKLEEHYKKEEEKVSVFRVTGEMFESEKRTRIMQYENETERMSILIITNVACEGQDMDYGNTIVNYDLDYNPIRLEQRRGRIDRFEVKKDTIYIHNFMVEGYDYNPAQPEEVCDPYSKVKKIKDKIDAIYESTGTYYEILEKDDRKSIPVDVNKLETKKNEVFDHLVEMVEGKCVSEDRKDSKELKNFMLSECLKQFGDYESVDKLISDKIRQFRNVKIAFSESASGVTVSTTIDNQELLHYIFNGGTLISHLVLEDR